jgi:hypothetical protein
LRQRIPRSIQEKAISKWLDGKPRDLVARELKISGGSVTGIIQSRRNKDREFDLMRVVSVQLRKLGITPEFFSPLIRFRQLLELEYSDSGKLTEVEEETIDSLIEALIVFCFRGKKTVAEFGALVQSIFHIADEFGIDLSNLPTYVNNLAAKATVIRKEIGLLCTKKERLLKDYEVTNDVINDILSNSPYMLGAYLDMKTRLREIENERDEYRNELKNLKMMIRAQEIEAARKAI